MKKLIVGIIAILLIVTYVGYKKIEETKKENQLKTQQQIEAKKKINEAKALFDNVYQQLDQQAKNETTVVQAYQVVQKSDVSLEEIKQSTKIIQNILEQKNKNKEAAKTKWNQFKSSLTEEQLANEKIQSYIKEVDEAIAKDNHEMIEENIEKIKSIKIEKPQLEVPPSNEGRVIDVATTEEFRRVVNKKNPIPKTFSNGEHPVAKNAFIQLRNDMQKLGFKVSNAYSGYRSYDYQIKIYNSIKSAYGQKVADESAARPGYSEHQTGLAYDFKDINGELLAENTILDGASEWLAKNAHRYGFVIRYPKGKESITGYIYEPWHVRFVGNDAEKIYKSGLTLEEYYGVDGGGYAE